MILFQSQQSWLPLSCFGGLLIGIAVSLITIFNGKVTGVSGIFYRSVIIPTKSQSWELSFVFGLLAGGICLVLLIPSAFDRPTMGSAWLVMFAGSLVGFGTRLGGGCTSGHGVCGLSRLSPRSIVATLLFIGFGMLVTGLLRHWWLI